MPLLALGSSWSLVTRMLARAVYEPEHGSYPSGSVLEKLGDTNIRAPSLSQNSYRRRRVHLHGNRSQDLILRFYLLSSHTLGSFMRTTLLIPRSAAAS